MTVVRKKHRAIGFVKVLGVVIYTLRERFNVDWLVLDVMLRFAA